MMEVEEVHSFRDADMIPEETLATWDDQMMQDDHHNHQPIPEVEMANEFPDDDIEYDMEDASGQPEFSSDPIIPPAEVVPVTEPIAATAIILPQSSTPPATDSGTNDNVAKSKPPELPVEFSTGLPVAVSEELAPELPPQREDGPVDASHKSEPAPSNEPASSPETALAEKLASPTASHAETHADGEPDRSERHEAVVSSNTAQEEIEGPADPQPEPSKEYLDPVDESATELYPSSVFILSPSSSTLPSFYLFAPPDDASSEEIVYFADQPQLFYEPLNTIFDALRAIAGDLGIMDHVELGLCSEALDLNVSEVRTGSASAGNAF